MIDDEIDWFNHTNPNRTPYKRTPISIMNIHMLETTQQRIMRMFEQLSRTCTACSMCSLGRNPAIKGHEQRDPHVFSNMNPSRYMVVGQNPGWNEVRERVPFVGDAGVNFNNELTKHGFSRDDFYICNSVRCYTNGNKSPSQLFVDRCRPFLQMEINLLQPLLVVTLGRVAFDNFCPDAVYSDSFNSIIKSSVFDVPVFPVYHPSPLNLADGNTRVAFEKQIKILCKLIAAINKRNQ